MLKVYVAQEKNTHPISNVIMTSAEADIIFTGYYLITGERVVALIDPLPVTERIKYLFEQNEGASR